MTSLLNYLKSFGPVSKEAEKALLSVARRIEVKKNVDLQPIGHTCKTIYFLETGIARIYYYKADVEVTESFSFENSLVVRYESLFTGRPSRKAIQMLEDAEVVAIDASALFRLYDQHHDVERIFRRIFEAALVDQVNRIESIQFHTAEERYHAFMKERPDALLRVPLKYIASYLGITPVSLSRIRAQR
ncbi:MAG: Crp/Fnr family transcriptional regulator [Chitinophagaceae bacterium]|nr:Crp/Fnr family transcriptional regulator [Chitinophagaceae bacterium]